MKKFFSILVIIIALTIAGIVGYGAYNYVTEKNSLKFTPIPSPDIDVKEDPVTVDNATSTVDVSKWKTYNNQELGYSIKYPEDLIVNYDALSLILAFPKDKYFHWPLLDDVKLTLVSTSTCASNIASSSMITINNIKYRLSKSDGAAMGTVYKEDVYEINGNNVCYKITYNSKGTNGAGFYVDDPSLIKKYDNQHSLDNDEVIKIIYGILGSFKINVIESGKVES
jgi:hypothetical protein